MTTHWSEGVYQLFKQQSIRQVSLVPDAGHAGLIKLCEADKDLRLIRLTSEEEGIAAAVGAWLGGDTSVRQHAFDADGMPDPIGDVDHDARRLG